MSMELLFSVQYQIKICQIWPSFILYVHVCSLIVCAITCTLYINIYLHIISYTIYISNVSFFWHIFYIFMMNKQPWNVSCFPFVCSTTEIECLYKGEFPSQKHHFKEEGKNSMFSRILFSVLKCWGQHFSKMHANASFEIFLNSVSFVSVLSFLF